MSLTKEGRNQEASTIEMEAIQDQFQAVVDGFIGQKLADQITTYTLTVAASLAFLVGFIAQDIRLTLYIALGGTALAFLAVVPAWPIYNQSPVKFLSVAPASAGGSGGVGTVVIGGEEVKVRT
ncbi:hypothetical protein Dda_0884 [Drechslerella dactyloides]|uniref:Signal peptidase complex subunit 1 n=1 Tax=Drechslerella dactyloides TaxID=74499 RepID=A0AAD6J5B7_DREDA|nr:hypothetical protein Dda_0884 [Drechslerella dactyloides]